MKRKIWLINAALLLLIGFLGWRLRLKWMAAQTEERALLSQAPRVRPVIPPPSPGPAAPVKPADYASIAERTLFSKDRNPTVVVQPPAPPPPPPPMPPLPYYYGQMAIGDPVVLLGTAAGDQKGYRAGEPVGKFKLVAFDLETVTFEWDGKPVVRKVQDLVPKEVVPQQQTTAPPATTEAPKSSIIAPAAPKPVGATAAAEPGTDMGSGFRGCNLGDTSPAGTVANGYKKIISQGLMGQSCYWEKVK